MLLTLEEMRFLALVTEKDTKGHYIAKPELNKKEKERLRSIDELNFISYNEHLIYNHQEIEKDAE